MDQVTMVHPDLPGQPITVSRSAIPDHARAGWQVADPPPPPPKRRRSKPAEPADKPAE
jgi:hypothetical protein